MPRPATRPLVLLLLVSVMSCSRTPNRQAPRGAAQAAADAAPQQKPAAPQGFVEMTVKGVMPTEQGNAVILVTAAQDVWLPIFIGDAEAHAIDLRLNRQRFQRPLTHDLLDAIMHDLGGRLVKIHVEDLRQSTFVGRVFVSQGDKLLDLDARPSDAIALAVGAHAPIYVHQKVIDQAGVRPEQLDPARPGFGPGPEARPPGSEPL